MKRINLISDTVTKPSPQMLAHMLAAQVGDDVFGEDPSVNALEEKVAEMFGMEAALFCPSGTMTNQIAIKIHTNPLDEVICDHFSHVFLYETGGYAFNSGCAIQTIKGQHGKITADQISAVIKGDFDWFPASRLVVIENSCNKGGGSFYTLDEIKPIHQLCKERNLKLHLDGARLFNVLVETKESTQEIGKYFDSISICISKGLGAPVGSLLVGNANDIKKARRFRKVMGGGMRQSGYLAAACTYALDHNIERLKIDNDRAKSMGILLSRQKYVLSLSPVKTNIVIFQLQSGLEAKQYVDYLSSKNITSSAFGKDAVRLVFHLDIEEEMIPVIEKAIESFKP